MMSYSSQELSGLQLPRLNTLEMGGQQGKGRGRGRKKEKEKEKKERERERVGGEKERGGETRKEGGVLCNSFHPEGNLPS